MFLSLSLANLLLYCVQQLGVTLGVGAQTILLVAYLQAMRDGIIDAKEAQFSRAVRGVLDVGLLCIILSGVGVGILEMMQGDIGTILQPAYLFKWALILFILLLNIFSDAVSPNVLEGLRGGTWFALFVVHILAPVTSWINLLTLYAVWMVGFNLVWMALLPLIREKKSVAKAVSMSAKVEEKDLPKIAPLASKIEVPKPAPPVLLPVVQPLEIDISTTFVPPKIQSAVPAPIAPTSPIAITPPVKDPDQDPGLPAVRVMPKTPADVENQNRASVVNFDQK